MSMPEFLLGNEAIGRGALEAGASFVSCYPGTPSSEAVEALLSLRDSGCAPDSLQIEYSVNEKVAMEAACGASIAGAPALVTMKHVGLNVAADPLMTAAYIGTPGGLVVLTGDDPGCHSSQNEQDNRAYARLAGICCLEPSGCQEACDMTKSAFSLSRELEEPVLLRTTTRVSHMVGPVSCGACSAPPVADFRPQASRFVPVPAVARKRHRALKEQLAKASEISEKSGFNTAHFPDGWDGKSGVIASGVARAYLADALRQSGLQDEIAVLELGLTWPLPEKKIAGFLEKCSHVLVLEEGEPILERDIRAIAQALPVQIQGKDSCLTEFGEYSQSLVLERLLRWLGREAATPELAASEPGLPDRPPNLCPGCAHRSVYYAVRKVFGDEAIYSSDIGCYTLGLLPPLKTADFLVCMGSSISAGSGFAAASGKTVVSFIGDSTFFHSGMTGLANAVFNKRDLLVVILDNGTTAMTGHQPNPSMSQELLGDGAAHMEIEPILAGLGIRHVRRVRSHNLRAVIKALEELRQEQGVRVLLAQEPCLLHASHGSAAKRKVAVVKEQGAAAETCASELACPAFTRKNGELAVDASLCGGCMVCVQIAPDAFCANPRP